MGGFSWRPVTPQELALKLSKTDGDADAKGLFRDVRLLNEQSMFGYPQNVISEYVRIKIFTDRGKDRYANVEIPYYDKNFISDVAGRTIRPDGSIVELGHDAIANKIVRKQGGRNVKVVAFVMPAVEPGAIIEYRWRRNVGEYISRYIPLDVQSEFPTEEVNFYIKPVTSQWVSWPTMRYLPFGCQIEQGADTIDGFYKMSVRHVPAFHEEPLMPPQYSAKQWILIYYEENSKQNDDKYWRAVGRDLYERYSQQVKVNREVKEIAQTAIGDSKTDEEKLDAIANYCRKHIKNIAGRDVTTEERESLKPNRTAIDTLKHGVGASDDIDYAFAALASAAGFETRVAHLADRGSFLFSPVMHSGFFLNTFDIAVKVKDGWQFYDPSNPDLPNGVLSWREEGVPALIADPKDSQFVTTPLLTAEQSHVARIAHLTLSPDGSLEGDVRELYAGNKAVEIRQRLRPMNETEREEDLKGDLKTRFADFELSKLKYNGLDDLTKAVGLTYHVRVTGYAQRTGKRLFVTPAYFEAGATSWFTAEKREHPIYFEYPWSESDNVSLQLPEGFTLDHPEAPASFNFQPVGHYGVRITLDKSNLLQYERDFVFGHDQVLLFGADAYGNMRQIFEQIRLGDTHLLTLKGDQLATTSGASSGPSEQ